jgi:acetylornithine deacetylase/succinyl-diaminopimelate desuccinylase-like protein
VTAVGAPSSAHDAATWSAATDELVETLRELIRIRSINPPPGDAPDGELHAARWIASYLARFGLEPEVVEPFPGRGSVHVRLRGDGTGGDPLLLLSHLDVVPAPPEAWSHGPFAAELIDGYVYGRGALDMKSTIALDLGVVRLLAEEARSAGLDPARDPIPGLRRDVLLTCTADEEAGGLAGVAWIVEHRPEWLQAAGALSEAGGVTTTIGSKRFYPIQVAEKGYAPFRITVHGSWGHGSMPRDDNAAVLAAAVIDRLAVPGPVRITPVMAQFLEIVAAELPDAAPILEALSGGDPKRAEAAIAAACDAHSARVLRALLRDSISPTVVRAGIKYNVIPGEAVIEVDCRILPGTTAADMQAQLVDRLGPELGAVCDVELIIFGPSVESPAGGELYDLLGATIRDHDPDGIPVPLIAPYGTDAKHTIPLGTPTYGFSPLGLAPGDQYLELWHAIDERVSVEALRWGLPVLYDVVRRFCG